VNTPGFAITLMNLRNIPNRLGASLVVVLGIGGVVGVLICVLAMAVGINKTIANTGRADRAIVLSAGALSEASSAIPRGTATSITHAAGVKRGSDDAPIAAAEALVQVKLPRNADDKPVGVTLRGVSDDPRRLRPEIALTAGRMFAPGTREVIVGSKASGAFGNIKPGTVLHFQNAEWTVVGLFASNPQSSHDSELLTDAETLLSEFARPWFQSVTVLLDSAGAFDNFKKTLEADPAIQVSAHRESAFFAAQSRPMTLLLTAIGYFIGSVMAVGAIFGALNTMYSAVSARTKEIATLRAVGFGPGMVVMSVFAESLTLALSGAVLGSLLAWVIFDGNTMSMMSLSGSKSQLAFSLAISPSLIATGIIWACVIGFIGGLFPALRAARMPVAQALRAS
jgi:putative ABC transport system permease protein